MLLSRTFSAARSHSSKSPAWVSPLAICCTLAVSDSNSKLDEDDYRAIKDMVQYMRELRKSSYINQEERQAVDKAFKKLDSKFVS